MPAMLSAFTFASAATVVLSSFLLFLVQPILAKQILPWFGGTSAVWTTCMVFFQCVLLAGYAYANWLQAQPPRWQRQLHVALLIAAAFTLPIIPDAAYKPTADGNPAVQIITLLVVTIGLAYFSLAATSPLLQRWLALSLPVASQSAVYRLFAWSNAGSLLALLAYPFAIEPWFDSREQSLGWSLGYAAFALACAWVAWRATSVAAASPAAEQAADTPNDDSESVAESAPSPSGNDYLKWIGLSALPSALLLAVTTHMTQNVASIPFLWVVPLSLYLVSFIVVFEGRGGKGFYSRATFLLPTLGLVVAMTWALSADNGVLHIDTALPLFALGLLAACILCHGELAAARPAPQHLTRFYLCMSAGGALGGLAIGIAAPLLLNAYWELPALMVLLCMLGVWVAANVTQVGGPRYVLMLVAAGALAGSLWYSREYVNYVQENNLEATRNFYGVLRVTEDAAGEGQTRKMLHGVILHGKQFTNPQFHIVPTTYYASTSGIGQLIAAYGVHEYADGNKASVPVRMGAVGLGTGTLLAYAAPGDTYVVYELDAAVQRAAEQWFTFIKDAEARTKARPEVRIGDARLTLERELAAGKPGRYDILAVDAFSSDAIPVHLITQEALALYAKHLSDRGVVAFHVSNRYLSLPPVVAGIAQANGMQALWLEDNPEASHAYKTDWVLVGRDLAQKLPAKLIEQGRWVEPDAGARVWSDSYNNLFKALKR
jgi:hypothetical protein